MATDTRDMGITHAAITTTTAVIRLTGRLTTPDGLTTTAGIERTSIISITTTATKSGGWCEVNWLAWSNSKPAFFSDASVAVDYAKQNGRSYGAVIWPFNESANVIETHKHAG